ncbi:MAG TPA: tetratricopeptide repeat protein, partial [Polyangia bacterium]|nr:tetratricopeptide repeat protein [Polyangia bacterium]
MPARRVLARACALALLLSAPGAARADDPDALIKQGVELRRAGRDEAALEQFRRAYDLAPTPRALAQMGLAEQALGRWIDGETHLSRALEGSQDPWIVKYRVTLEGSLAEIGKHLGSLFVTGGPEGAELRVDGQAVGTLPLRRPLRLPLGTFALEASAGGHVVVARAVSIAAGITAHEDLSGPAPPPVAPSSAPTPASVSREAARDDEAGAAHAEAARRTLAWVATGGAVTLAAAGGIVLFLGDRDARSYNATCPAEPAGGGCSDLATRGRREQLAGVAALVAGGALGATAAWLFFSEPARASGERRLACAPALDRWGGA